ncbi:hypothetical protein [Diaphorobacter sp. LR2014-1]|uniref:hypothetical protein n=1 Tax=Diaphorobacter sp. LR2014-1 TaxID=1933219 RepID=UPI000CDA5615|nr:hypothetical protein [Diaphorobacter sp. LR2014-1]POR07961.1 hypothetical protein BV908_18440 [Diaphorobacter sp. LR2014-1]
MSKDQIILDDGVYFVDLNCNYETAKAPGFLQRRCSNGLTTPGGYECVGSFDKAADGTWRADVNAAYDPETDGDCRRVIEGVSRMDAIAALWAARKSDLATHN